MSAPQPGVTPPKGGVGLGVLGLSILCLHNRGRGTVLALIFGLILVTNYALHYIP
ncbi:hypothetical protein [Kutzneria chonburiensis]|uniref:Uncharacterized protein n=1 Tax=Kutzneria chonburiensis TaxID=1483604 RepID=A0ABV6MRT5_9PSEU|nr:hypothetical protein [Kutzneria chonburiensis]